MGKTGNLDGFKVRGQIGKYRAPAFFVGKNFESSN
jgi:hypothetical protein